MAGVALKTRKPRAKSDPGLLAHLYRRAGFGATRDQLERLAAKEYSEVVDFLLNPTPEASGVSEDEIARYMGGESATAYLATWLYRMINSECQLQEKIALFWHYVFATGLSKNEHILSASNQIDMFRHNGLGDMRAILMDISRDPAMIFWLDNNENHKGEPNENYGRELLELFSMGVGNYTENDIKNAARAFTGWTFAQPPPLYPQGYYPAQFRFIPEDHDYGKKTFLGQTGNFDGGDIVDIIVRQPACARFVSRHLYNFFVADEPQVPSWNDVPPQDPKLIDAMSRAFLDSGGQIREVLRVMFNSDSFKSARFKKVKSPTELVAGVLKMVGSYDDFRPGLAKYVETTTVAMGQKLLDPPTVEGWHTGREWIDGGNLTERVNFAVEEIGDGSVPGIRRIVDRLTTGGAAVSEPSALVDATLDLIGPIDVDPSTREALVKFAIDSQKDEPRARIVRLLRLIVATPDYQLA
ncbi:MAG: DUF1800 domain-containing protein [SAR202 cluster bacterium]|nr:DUF1800 domain-containing protein [SAR202 cluster bacterium]